VEKDFAELLEDIVRRFACKRQIVYYIVFIVGIGREAGAGDSVPIRCLHYWLNLDF